MRALLFRNILIAGLLICFAGAAQGDEEFELAIIKGDTQKVGQLLERGADANSIVFYGTQRPLHLAAARESIEIVRLLIAKGADVNTRNKDQQTPLHRAFDKNIAELLVAKGADVNARDSAQYTPLHMVAKKEVADVLIAHGANVNARNEYQQTPLYMTNNKDIAELLIAKGADVNARDSTQHTPLHAVSNKEVAEVLIAHGADVNARDSSQSTPLHEAVKSGRTDVAKFLVSKGADFNARDGNGLTPASLADQTNHPELAEMLRKLGSGGSPRQSLDELIQRLNKAGYLLNADVEAAVRLARTLTPRPTVSQEAQDEMVKGNAAFKLANSPQDFATAEGHFKKTALLAPWWPDPYVNWSLAQEKQRKYYDAQQTLGYYLTAAPDAPDSQAVKGKIAELELRSQRKQQSDEQINRSAELYNIKDYNGAIRAGKEAIRIDPENPLGYTVLGMAYDAADQYQEAIPIIKEALARGIRSQKTYQSLGRPYFMLGQSQKAIEIYEEALKDGEWADRGFTMVRLGKLYEDTGQVAKALEQYENAMNYMDTDPNASKFKAWVIERIQTLKRQLGR